MKTCHTIDDLKSAARDSLPRVIFDYLEGGAEEERTQARNTAAFDDIKLLPRCLVDVSRVSTATRVLGQDIAWPVFCSPTGGSRMYHRDGELAVARAAQRSGTYYGLSTMSTYTLEDVAGVSAGPKLFQLYVFKDRDITRELIARCKAAGYTALCLTVDAPVRGNRERELRSGMGMPMKLSWASLASFALHPRWAADLVFKGLSFPNFAARTGSNNIVAQTRYIAEQLDASISWSDIGEMIELWGGPFAIKGVMHPDDARRAADVGASAVIVSNHGGRQLDGAAGAIEALPAVVAAAGDKLEVILDGGVRRGTHVIKALALGAKACSIGRPYLYGLAAGGEAGVDRALAVLRAEVVRTLQLMGCTDVRALGPDVLMRP